MDISNLKNLALNHKKDYKKLASRLKNNNNVDNIFNNLHNEEFMHINCLDCANCCKSLGPRLRETDIKRISKQLKIKESEFVSQYLNIDEDNDFVFKSMPCPFLMENNYCSVYESRPKACKDYPHTNHKNIKSNLNLHIKNSETCPVVFNIFLRLSRSNNINNFAG